MPTEATDAGSNSSMLWTGLFFVVGCGLVFAGYLVQGLEIATCPVMGYNGIVTSCIQTFPGTDIPITPAGNMVMIVGGVLIVTTLALVLHARLVAKSPREASQTAAS